MDKTATAADPGSLESSFSSVGFTEDANAADDSSVATAVEEPETGLPADEAAETEIADEETPEQGQEESEEETSGEQEEAATEEGEKVEEPQGYDVLLPTKQQKAYPEELYQLAAKKFGIDQSLLTQKPIRDLLKGKIDSDIDNRNLREQLSPEEEAEEADEPEEARTEAAPAAETFTPQRQLESTFKFLREGLDGSGPIVSDEGAKLYSEMMLEAYTGVQEAIESGDAKKIASAHRKHAETQLAFATTAFANVFPALMPRMLAAMPEQLWDGIVGAKLEQREELRETHQAARDLLKADPRYAADVDKFIKSKEIYNFVRDNPEVMEKQFLDSNRRPITDPVRLNAARYRFVINQLRGQNYRPPQQLVKEAQKSGERHANAMAAKKAAGKVTPGRTRGTFGGQGDRYGDREWADRMKRAAENSNPLGAFADQPKP